MYKKSVVHHIARWVIEIMFYGGILCTVSVPFVIGRLMEIFSYAPEAVPVYRVTLTVSGALAVYILFNIKNMYKTLLEGSPFVDKNVSAFRRMAVAAAGICVVFMVQTVLAFTVGSLTIGIIFAIACLFSLTLKDLFKQAINYKTENDLTI